MHLCVLAGVCHAELFSHRRMKTRGRGYLLNMLCTVVVFRLWGVAVRGGVGRKRKTIYMKAAINSDLGGRWGVRKIEQNM